MRRLGKVVLYLHVLARGGGEKFYSCMAGVEWEMVWSSAQISVVSSRYLVQY